MTMRRMLPIELLLNPEPVQAIARGLARVAWRAKGMQVPTADGLMRALLERTLDAWEHAGIVVLAQVNIVAGRSVARVCYAAGEMGPVLDWYWAWEAECRAHHIDEMRIGGRKGWYRMAQRLKAGFRSDPSGEIVKDLH